MADVGPDVKATVGATLVTLTLVEAEVVAFPALSVTVNEIDVAAGPSAKMHLKLPIAFAVPLVPGKVSEPGTLVPDPQLPTVPVEGIPPAPARFASRAEKL